MNFVFIKIKYSKLSWTCVFASAQKNVWLESYQPSNSGSSNVMGQRAHGLPSAFLCLYVFPDLSTRYIISLTYKSVGFDYLMHNKEKNIVILKKPPMCVDRT